MTVPPASGPGGDQPGRWPTEQEPDALDPNGTGELPDPASGAAADWSVPAPVSDQGKRPTAKLTRVAWTNQLGDWLGSVPYATGKGLGLTIGSAVVAVIGIGIFVGSLTTAIPLIFGIVAAVVGLVAVLMAIFTGVDTALSTGRQVHLFVNGMTLPNGRSDYVVPWTSARISTLGGEIDSDGNLRNPDIYGIGTLGRPDWNNLVDPTADVREVFAYALGRAHRAQRELVLTQLAGGGTAVYGDVTLSGTGFVGEKSNGAPWTAVRGVRVVDDVLLADVDDQGIVTPMTVVEIAFTVPNLSLVVDLMRTMADRAELR